MLIGDTVRSSEPKNNERSTNMDADNKIGLAFVLVVIGVSIGAGYMVGKAAGKHVEAAKVQQAEITQNEYFATAFSNEVYSLRARVEQLERDRARHFAMLLTTDSRLKVAERASERAVGGRRWKEYTEEEKAKFAEALQAFKNGQVPQK